MSRVAKIIRKVVLLVGGLLALLIVVGIVLPPKAGDFLMFEPKMYNDAAGYRVVEFTLSNQGYSIGNVTIYLVVPERLLDESNYPMTTYGTTPFVRVMDTNELKAAGINPDRDIPDGYVTIKFSVGVIGPKWAFGQNKVKAGMVIDFGAGVHSIVIFGGSARISSMLGQSVVVKIPRITVTPR